MSRLQIEIIYFWLTFDLTGLHFRGELNYVNLVGKQKIKFRPVRIWKSLLAICSFSCVNISEIQIGDFDIKCLSLMILFVHVRQVIS